MRVFALTAALSLVAAVSLTLTGCAGLAFPRVSEGATASSSSSDTLGAPSATPSSPADAQFTPEPVKTVTGPASFAMPNFVGQDENEVDSWMFSHGILVTTEFDYGEDDGTDCQEAGDGVVDTQSVKAGTKLANKASTSLTLEVSCG